MPEPPSPEVSQPKPLKSTLNLPQTAFPMKAGLPVNEPIRLKQWQDPDGQGLDLYGQIRAARAGSPRYILHDGPPYANGAIHLGHALNKCLKDFVVKTKTMAGFDAPYVPGWDCHGLPIEIKVDEQLGRKKLEMDPVAVRQACRAYAQKYLDLQRSQFLRMGIFGRWQQPYSTMDPAYEAHIAETFFHFFERGFVYKGLKPVFWCIHDRTALAEAEVEYEQHTSPSIYVRYKLTSNPALIDPVLSKSVAKDLSSFANGGGPASQPATDAKSLSSIGEAGGPASRSIYTIIWTTTPWTIPASQAVAFNPDLEYVALATSTGIYVVAQALLSSVIVHCHLMSAEHPEEPASQEDILTIFKGEHLEATTYQHPFLDRQILGVTADYVTADQGTGAVHTAPAHGVDDFATGRRYNLPDIQFVDDAGRQMHTAEPGGHPKPYESLTIFKSNSVIIDILREHGALLSTTNFEHSYPHCWRCHNPVIVRATEQWFIDMETPMPEPTTTKVESTAAIEGELPPGPPFGDFNPPPAVREFVTPLGELATLTEVPDSQNNLSSFRNGSTAGAAGGPASRLATEPPTTTTFRQRALEEIKRVQWDPSWGQERITNMVATRPDWCISRQRIWGVPIAIFLCRKCSEPLKDPAINKMVVALFEKESADAWYFAENTPEKLLPAGTTCKACGHHEFRKEMDILDVWFESGASSHAVLDFDPDTQQAATDADKRADLYAEGGDQHRGWFMSSLLCNIGMHNTAPFKSVATYGWTLDEKGRALSKSLGNFIDPVLVMDQLGGDIVRLWVASVDFREDVVASLPLLKRLAEEIYRKLRNTFRFLLGNLHDFDPATNLVEDFATLEPLDQYMLVRTADVTEKIKAAYAAFEFHRVYHLLNEFCNSDLSALYLDVLKDRLYTFAPNAPARRSAQTVLYRITDALARLTAPILSFTAEEVWQSMPHPAGTPTSVHLKLFPYLQDLVPAENKQMLGDWKVLLGWRQEILLKLEHSRQVKLIGKALEAEVTILRAHGHLSVVSLLSGHSNVLSELCNVSSVYLIAPLSRKSDEFELDPTFIVRTAEGTKCERCWRYTGDVAADPNYPTVCQRCAEALSAIAFPPYSLQLPL